MAGRGYGRGRGRGVMGLLPNAMTMPSYPAMGSDEIPPHSMIRSCAASGGSSHDNNYGSGSVDTDDGAPVSYTDEVSKNSSGASSKWAESVIQRSAGQISTAEMKNILGDLERAWNTCTSKDKSQVSQQIRHYFTSSKNPYELALYLAEKSKDLHVAKTTTFAYHLMQEFESWCRKDNNNQSEQYLTNDIRLRALVMCTRFHTVMFHLVVKSFELQHPGNEYMVPIIRGYVEKQKYKEAALCVGKLQLQDSFHMNDILLPLLLQDKVNMIEAYLIGNAKLQQTFVELLDKMCDITFDVNKFIEENAPHLPNVKRDKLQRKTISKLAIRLSKLYDIPPESCQNISTARGLGAVKFLLYKRYIDGSMGAGSWEEMVMSAVGDNVYLMEQLVWQLQCYNELQAAAKWAQFYNLPDESLPPSVVTERIRQLSQNNDDVASEVTSVDDWDSECTSEIELQAAYYQLKLPMEQITMVDTRDMYHKCIDRLSVPGTVVGIDSEWKPSFGNTIHRIGLIQLAVADHVYLIDVVTLSTVLSQEEWMEIITLFCNRAVLKLGYGLGSDLQMFVKTFPFMREKITEIARIVELEKLAQIVIDKAVSLLPDSVEDEDEEPVQEDNDSGVNIKFSKQEDRGLSELVKQSLGKPLNKAEQMSDWEKRPLRKQQVIYAALDAFVLLEVYEVLVKEAKKQARNIDLEPPITMKWLKPSKREKQKAKAKGIKIPKRQLPSREEMSAAKSNAPVSPGDMKFVVDSMLEGLGRRLRSVGVDVYFKDQNQEHMDVVQIALTQNRYVLSAGLPYSIIKSHVGSERCYCVQNVHSRDQLKEVLNHYNIKVTQKDIFSRCQICNGNEYLEVPTMELLELSKIKQKLHESTEESNISEKRPISTAYASSSKDTNPEVRYGIKWADVNVASNGVPVKLEPIPLSRYHKVETFYVCATCGKVFWEGSHFENIVTQFSDVLNMDS